MGPKKYFSIFSSQFFKTIKNNVNVNFVNLAKITFPHALNFSILEKRRCSLLHIETTKPQRPDSIAPGLPGTKKCFLQIAWSTICILYNIYEQSHVQRALLFLISKNMWAQYLIHQFYRKKVLTVWQKCFRDEDSYFSFQQL